MWFAVERVIEITNYKHQISNKFQYRKVLGTWCLGFYVLPNALRNTFS